MNSNELIVLVDGNQDSKDDFKSPTEDGKNHLNFSFEKFFFSFFAFTEKVEKIPGRFFILFE